MDNRLQYIDIAKAIFMIFIVMDHTGVIEPFPICYDSEVPAFIFLSGLFFSVKDAFSVFVKAKFKRIVIPFLFFYLISYLAFVIGKSVYPPLASMTEAKGFMDVFSQKQLFNGALWFLPALFFVQIIYYPIEKFVVNNYIKFIVILIIGIIGALLGTNGISLPLFFDNALALLPYFYIGKTLMKTGFFNNTSTSNICKEIVFSVIIIVILYMVYPISVQPSLNLWSRIYLVDVVMLTLVSGCVLLLCKFMPSILLAWIGRNTMFIMCTHHIIYRPIKQVLMSFGLNNSLWSPILVSIITMLLVCLMAPIVSKYLPWTIGLTVKKKTN